MLIDLSISHFSFHVTSQILTWDFFFQELQQFLVFCSSSLLPSASNCRELLPQSWVSWGLLKSSVSGSIAGSSLTPSHFSLGSIQQHRPNKLAGLLLGDIKLQTQISKWSMSDSLWLLHCFHTSPLLATHSSIQTSLRALVYTWNIFARVHSKVWWSRERLSGHHKLTLSNS